METSTPLTSGIIRLRVISLSFILIVIFLGSASLFGWILDIPFLIAPLFWTVPINPLSSIFFILIGVTMLFDYLEKQYLIFKYIPYLIIIACASILLGMAFRFNFRIDRLLVDRIFNQYPVPDPFRGGISTFSAIDFILCSISLLLLQQNGKTILRQLLNLVSLLIALIPLVCYINKVPEAQPYFLIPPYSAVSLILISIATLFLKPEEGFVKQIVGKNMGGIAARYFIPIALILPILFGHLRLRAEWSGVVSSALGQTITSIGIASILATITWYVAYILNRRSQIQSDKEEELAKLNSQLFTSFQKKEALNEQLQQSLEELKTKNEELNATNDKLEEAKRTIARQKDEQLNRVLDSSYDVIWSFDLTGNGDHYFSRSIALFGIDLETLQQDPFFLLKLAQDEYKDQLAYSLNSLWAVQHIEFTCPVNTLNGERWISVQLNLIKDEAGNNLRLEGIASDITELKRNQRLLDENRENLEIIFENATDFFALLDTDARIITLNRPFKEFIFKYSKIEPRIGISFFDVVAPNRIAVANELIQRALKGERIRVISESIFENETRYYDVIYSPILKDGVVTHITITSTDITERKLQENEIGKFRENLEIIFNNSSDNFLLMDTDANIILFNHGFKKFAETFVGITPQIGMSLYQVVPHSRVQANKKMVARALTGEKVKDLGKVQYQGETRYFDITYEPVYHDGHVTHITLSSFEVTEVTEYRLGLEKKVEERTRELQIALQKEKEMIEMQKRFITVASHEFRTPLSAISLTTGFIKKFQDKLSHDEIQKRLETIDVQVNNMNELLQDVLTAGKIEAGRDQLQLKDINLRETIEQIILEVRSSVAETHEINFVWKCTHSKFKTDESKIRHIVINLLNNAIKFSKESNKAIDILVTCQEGDLVIDVHDYGVGIPENELNKLFQPFYRASNAATVAGTGLGLSIVFKSVEVLGGKIEVKSELKAGTLFKVRLPFL